MMPKLNRMISLNKIVTILSMLFFLEMGVFFVLAKDKFKVLILHSYTPDYSWSRSINEGIGYVLSKEKATIISSYHYMATKDASGDQIRRAKRLAHRRIEDFEPDIILAIDDNANAMVARNYVGHKSIDIIFAGVNGSVTRYGYDDAPNVTGIYERKPVGALVELINIMNHYDGKFSSVVFVSDKSRSAKHDAEYMKEADWGDKIFFKEHISTNTFTEWKEIITSLPDDVDYVLVGGYRKLTSEDNPEVKALPHEIAQWTVQNSKKPVIGLNVFNSEDGIPLSVGVSPYEQGEVAANILLGLLETGEPAGNLAHIHPQQYLISMNATAINGRQEMYDTMPALLEVFAKATHNYFSGIRIVLVGNN